MSFSLRIVVPLAVMVVWGAGCTGRTVNEGATGDHDDRAPVADSIGTERCVEEYSAETLRDVAFAFDGTILSIESRRDPRLPANEGPEDQIVPWVTFEVNRWYQGGSGDQVGVWIETLNTQTSVGTIAGEPGTRLLVGGRPRWGGAPLDDPIAWACGFTQPWSEDAAAEWKAAFSD